MSFGGYSLHGGFNHTQGISGRTSYKRVFNTSMVAHIWAQQKQEEGRNAKGSIYFKGATIYSYGAHYPIARFTGHTHEGNRVVLINSEHSTPTTQGHKRDVRDALRGLNVLTFDVPDVDADRHEGNLAALLTDFEAEAKQAAKAHAQSWRTEDMRVDSLRASYAGIVLFARVFNLPLPADAMLPRALANVRAAFAKYNDPKAVAKREKDALKRLRQYQVPMAQALAHAEGCYPAISGTLLESLPKDLRRQYGLPAYCWRKWDKDDKLEHSGRQQITPEQWQDGQGAINALDYSMGTTLLRKVGERLQTSRGVEVPWAQAVIAFKMAARCRRTGKAWHRNGETLPVGHFQVDTIEANGALRAGCHTLAWAEMLRVAVLELPAHEVPDVFPVPARIVP